MAFTGAIKDNGSVYIVKESPFLFDQDTIFDEENLEVYKPHENKHVLLCCAKDAYLSQIISDIDKFISPREESFGIDKRYLIKSTLPKLVNEFTRLRVLKKGKIEGEDFGLVIAVKDKVFYIGGSYTVREIGDIEFFNFANPFMCAAFDELGDMPVIDKLKISMAQFDDLYNPIHFPVIVRNTMSDDIIFITRRDAYKAYDNYIKGGNE